MNYINWLYWVTFSVLGCITGHQILLRQVAYRTISKKTLGFLIIFFMPCYIFLIWCLKSSLVALLIAQIILVVLEYYFILFMTYRRRKSFNQLLIPFLDDLALNLAVGASFREAILSLKLIKDYENNIDLCEIIEAFSYQTQTQQNSCLCESGRHLLMELQKIYSSNLNVLLKVQALRTRYRSEQVLDEKIQVAISQSKAQAMVCVFLYLGLLGYTAASRSSFLLTIWFMVSIGLMLTGLLIMKQMSASAMRVKL
jgi:Flp pilus assembly protein TadB